MSKIVQGLVWVRDVAEVLVLNRFQAGSKSTAERASTACRSLRFHLHAKIRPLPWAELFSKLGVAPVEHVSLPGPATDLGDVGSAAAYQMLAALVKALDPRTILEFGTYLGVSTYAMALNTSPACRIYTVDLPDAARPEAVPELNAIDQHHITTSRFRVGEAFLRSPLAERIRQIREDSLTFRAEQHLAAADLVFVDGGHSLPVVTRDTENAFRVLSPTGAIVWDDYFHLYPDVVRFLDGLADRYPLYRLPETNCVLYSRRFADALPPRLP